MVMRCFLFTLVLCIAVLNYGRCQFKIYKWVPLCCKETEAYNGSTCIPFKGKIPLNIPNQLNNGTVEIKHDPIKNCLNSTVVQPIDEFTITVLHDGSLTLKKLAAEDVAASEFCLQRNLHEEYEVRFCPARNSNSPILANLGPHPSRFIDCKEEICISKCCAPGNHVALRPRSFACISSGNETSAFVPNFKFTNNSVDFVNKTVSFIVQFPLCKVYDGAKINLLRNGTIFLPSTGEIVGKENYCLDTFEIGGRKTIRGSVCSKTIGQSVTDKLRNMLYPFGFLISCIFLAATFICHVIIPKLRDMQGLCFMSYVASLFVAFLLLCVNFLLPNSFSRYGCAGLGILNQFSLMASFFWLNVLCFDIWKIIRGTTHVVLLDSIHSNKKRTFIIYSLYSWGFPFVVSVTAFVLHVLPPNSIPDNIIRPEFRKSKCWFTNDVKVLFAYYYGIIAVLFLFNIIFIVHTSVMLYKAGVAFTFCRSKKAISDGQDFRGNNRLLLNMFWHRFCLFALMALNWTTEVLSFIPPVEMWIITDVLNTLQGLFIFILFIRSTNKRMMIKEAWKKVVKKTRKKVGKVPPANGKGPHDVGNEEFGTIARFINKRDDEAEVNFVETDAFTKANKH